MIDATNPPLANGNQWLLLAKGKMFSSAFKHLKHILNNMFKKNSLICLVYFFFNFSIYTLFLFLI